MFTFKSWQIFFNVAAVWGIKFKNHCFHWRLIETSTRIKEILRDAVACGQNVVIKNWSNGSGINLPRNDENWFYSWTQGGGDGCFFTRLLVFKSFDFDFWLNWWQFLITVSIQTVFLFLKGKTHFRNYSIFGSSNIR